MKTYSNREIMFLMAGAFILGIAATSIVTATNSDGGSRAVKADLRDGVARVCAEERALTSKDLFDNPRATEIVYRCAGARDAAWVVVTRAGEREAGL